MDSDSSHTIEVTVEAEPWRTTVTDPEHFCRRAVAAAGKPVSDHLAHLLVHGALHLLGHDHEEDEETLRMEAREVELLAGLGVADPYRAEAAP